MKKIAAVFIFAVIAASAFAQRDMITLRFGELARNVTDKDSAFKIIAEDAEGKKLIDNPELVDYVNSWAFCDLLEYGYFNANTVLFGTILFGDNVFSAYFYSDEKDFETGEYCSICFKW